MNVLCWNCRGTASKGFAGLIKDLRREFSFSLMMLVETHTSGNRALGVIRRLGFDGKQVVDATGHAGGIWILWDSSVWAVKIISSSPQIIHMEVSWRNEATWYLFAVYGNPHHAQRQYLWDEIVEIHQNISGPWALLGDFNGTLNDNERAGPPLVGSQRHDSGFNMLSTFAI